MGRNYVAGFVGNSLMKATSLRAASGEDIGEATKTITIIRNAWFQSPLFPFKKDDWLRENLWLARARTEKDD